MEEIKFLANIAWEEKKEESLRKIGVKYFF